MISYYGSWGLPMGYTVASSQTFLNSRLTIAAQFHMWLNFKEPDSLRWTKCHEDTNFWCLIRAAYHWQYSSCFEVFIVVPTSKNLHSATSTMHYIEYHQTFLW